VGVGNASGGGFGSGTVFTFIGAFILAQAKMNRSGISVDIIGAILILVLLPLMISVFGLG
jgi:hypothetical protein